MKWVVAVAGVLAGCSFEGGTGTVPVDASVDPDASIDASIDGAMVRGDRISCAPLAPAVGMVTPVSTAPELVDAVEAAVEGEVIVLSDGTYALTAPLSLDTAGIRLRSESGDPNDVIILGPGDPDSPSSMNSAGVLIEASGVTIEGVTVSTFRRPIRLLPTNGTTIRDTSLTHLRVLEFSEVGIDVQESADGTGITDGGLFACSTIVANRLSFCNDVLIGVDFNGSSNNWRVTENVIGPACPVSATTHVGIRFVGQNRFMVVDHNMLRDWRSGMQVGNSSTPNPACDGENGLGWEVFGTVICSNAVVYEQSATPFVPSFGMSFLQACETLAIYNTVVSDSGPDSGLRFSGAGSVVSHANNAVSAPIDGGQSAPPISEPERELLLVEQFVAFPDDIRLRVQPADALDFSDNELAEKYCSWDLTGAERNPSNPGYGAFAP